MKNLIIKTLILSFFSGVLISIGCVVNLSCDNRYIGALAFSCGLFFICECGFKLYTGAIGYALDNKKEDNLMLLFILIGNFVGCLFFMGLISFTRIDPTISEKALILTNTKLNDTWYSVLILSIGCGMLIFLGVDTFKKSSNNVSKVIALLFCVFVFIISSYEHCIANMFYIMESKTWSLKAVLYIIIMVIGNSIGGLIIPGLKKLIKND